MLVRSSLIALLVVLVSGAAEPPKYLPGGPLAGVELPRFAPQHGEPAGHPGSVPALAAKALAEALAAAEQATQTAAAARAAAAQATGEAKAAAEKLAEEQEAAATKAAEAAERARDPLSARFTTVGLYPEWELYPGSVEHWRSYMIKYMPIRPLFDRQSQVKNWVAPDLPGATAAQRSEYAEPVWWVPRWGDSVPTGLQHRPVPVVRLGVDDPPLKLDCGTLPAGAYVVRLIAAVPTAQVRYFRRPLFVRMTVNDGVQGERSTYVKRVGYVDDFYSVSELFFSAPAERAYQVEVAVAPGSEVALLVHNVSLDDCLAGVEQRAVKQRPTLLPERAAAIKTLPNSDLPPEQRLARDAWLWSQMPRSNAQGSRPYQFPKSLFEGADGKVPGDLGKEYGVWRPVALRGNGGLFAATPADPRAFLYNDKLKLTYTLDDYANQRPLPQPYPYADTGVGLTWPSAEDERAGTWFAPIATAISDLYWYYPTAIHKSVEQWEKTGQETYARDAAIALARWAYAFPTLVSQECYLDNLISSYNNVGRDSRFRSRDTNCRFYRWYTEYANEVLDDYDLLFPYLSTNQALADSIGRFVPWVKTPQDVVKLVDSYLVQGTAKRVLRFQWHTGETMIVRLATVLGDNQFTRPWLQWLFTSAFVYPLPIAGLPDLMVTGCSREGPEYIASTYYAGGENAIPKAAALEEYIKAGGLAEFRLSDPVRFPKPLATCYWQLERHVAGLNHLRIGDVTGPDKYQGGLFTQGLDDASYWGWKWGRDPRFAYIRKHYFGQRDFTAAEWAELEQAAATVARAPWLDLPSRVLPQWAAILETGRQFDDFRFRTAATLRLGMGWGHHHNDPLDLQVYAHGTMMTCDGGQRPGYSRPGDRSTRMHNLVEVDGDASHGGEWLSHSWARTLADAPGAQYAMAEATPPAHLAHVSRYQRQTAVLDVDEGRGAEPLSHAEYKPGSKLPAEVVTPNAYVVDIFRVAGGKLHTYAFHGNLSSAVTHNLADAKPIAQASEDEQQYVSRMLDETKAGTAPQNSYWRKDADARLAGTAPAHLKLAWQLEEKQVKADWQPNLPTAGPYVTQLHLLGEAGARVLRGSLDCKQWKYTIPMAFVQRRAASAAPLESAFAAVIEPYVGQPFLRSLERLTIADNAPGAAQAVALAIATVNDHRDLVYADLPGAPVRQVGDSRIGAEFAYASRDAAGLLQATLVGGELFESPDLVLRPTAREYAATVTAADYAKRTLTLDQSLPARDQRHAPFVFEVGTQNHWTTYTATKLAGNTVTVRDGADYYLSEVKAVDEAAQTVTCTLSFASGNEGGEPAPGMDRHWVASNEDATRFWRAEYQGGDRATASFHFKLDGPVKLGDFPGTRRFRLWEYGAGDTLRHRTQVALRRTAPGVHRVTADVPFTLALPGAALAWSADGKTWQPLPTQAAGKLVSATLTAEQIALPELYLQVR